MTARTADDGLDSARPPPAGRTYDAVIAAMAWHQVDPVAGAAKAARVLRPGGRLAVFWNAFGPPPDLADAFADVYVRVMGDSPAYRRPMPGPDAYATLVAKAAGALRETDAFGEPEEWRFEREQYYIRDEWLDVVPTYGSITRLPAEKLRRILAGMGAAVDAAGGGFMMRYTAVVGTAVRTGTA